MILYTEDEVELAFKQKYFYKFGKKPKHIDKKIIIMIMNIIDSRVCDMNDRGDFLTETIDEIFNIDNNEVIYDVQYIRQNYIL